jgi:hypothetical protein
MFIIATSGTVKALMAVTISLHPGAHQVAASYTVQPGDSLSTIAAHTYGNAADWPAVWWVNRHQMANPNLIAAGEQLRLPTSGQVPTWMAHAAQAAIPASAPAPAAVSVPQASAPAAASVSTAAPASSTAAPASSGGANWSAIASCESGGNWSANTGNGFYGGLQFTEQTWLGYGGGQYASAANQATEAQQITVAERVLAGQGIGAWPVCGAGG